MLYLKAALFLRIVVACVALLVSVMALASSKEKSAYIELPLSSSFDELVLSYKNCGYVDFYALDLLPEDRIVLQYFCNNPIADTISSTFVDLNSKRDIAPLFPYGIDIDSYHVLEKKLGVSLSFYYEPARHADEDPVVYLGSSVVAIMRDRKIEAECGCLCRSKYYRLEARSIDGEVIARKVLFGLRPAVAEVESSGPCRSFNADAPSDAPTYRSSIDNAMPVFWPTTDGRLLIAGKTNLGRLPVLFAVPTTLDTSKILFGGMVALLDADIYAAAMKKYIEDFNQKTSGDRLKGNKSAMEYAEAELRKAMLNGEFDEQVKRQSKSDATLITRCPVAGDQKSALALNLQGEALYRENVDKAQAFFEQAIQQDASLAKAYSNLALVYYKKKKLEGAEQMGKLAAACGWRDHKLLASSLFNLGKLFEERGDLKKAMYLYDQADRNNQQEIYRNARNRLSGFKIE